MTVIRSAAARVILSREAAGTEQMTVIPLAATGVILSREAAKGSLSLEAVAGSRFLIKALAGQRSFASLRMTVREAILRFAQDDSPASFRILSSTPPGRQANRFDSARSRECHRQ